MVHAKAFDLQVGWYGGFHQVTGAQDMIVSRLNGTSFHQRNVFIGGGMENTIQAVLLQQFSQTGTIVKVVS